MENITIEKAKSEESSEILDIFVKARKEMTYLPQIHTHDETRNFIEDLVKSGNVFVAKENRKITGFMEVENEWLHHLYIAPSYQSKGYGKLMLDKAKELSPNALKLWVFEDNKNAIKFYEREGFKLQKKRSQKETTNEENLPDRLYSWKEKTTL